MQSFLTPSGSKLGTGERPEPKQKRRPQARPLPCWENQVLLWVSACTEMTQRPGVGGLGKPQGPPGLVPHRPRSADPRLHLCRRCPGGRESRCSAQPQTEVTVSDTTGCTSPRVGGRGSSPFRCTPPRESSTSGSRSGLGEVSSKSYGRAPGATSFLRFLLSKLHKRSH